MNAEIFLTLLGGFGIGTIVTTIVQHILKRKSEKEDQYFQERKEVFVGILQSIEDLQNEYSKEKSSKLGYWIARANLVAETVLNNELKILIDTKPNTTERKNCFDRILTLMKNNLGFK